jgi:hypothetical protein
MFSFLLWCILLIICWPLALLALVKAIIFLPARVLRGRVRA